MGILKIGDLELCPDCIKKRVGIYNFNNRCCRAKHTLSMPVKSQEDKFNSCLEKYGKGYVDQLKMDMRRMEQYKKSVEFEQ